MKRALSASRPGAATTQRQLEYLQQLASRTVGVDISLPEYRRTSGERCERWVHQPMVAALDLLNAYEQRRKVCVGPLRLERQFSDDPRTRAVEVLKRYLYAHLQCDKLDLQQLQRHTQFCHGLVQPDLFGTRNACSFVQTMAEVHELLEELHYQLLKKSTTCAELLATLLTVGKNLVADASVYLLLCTTDLPVAKVRSFEPVLLLSELEAGALADQPASLAALAHALLADARPIFAEGLVLEEQWGQRFAAALEGARADLAEGRLAKLGVDPALRKPEYALVLEELLAGFERTHALVFFLGAVLQEFGRIGELFGDYGAIASSRVLHPVLSRLGDLAHGLRQQLSRLEQQLDHALVIVPAKLKQKRRPNPLQRRLSRERVERCVGLTDDKRCHVHALCEAIEQLKRESCPERLPRLRAEAEQVCGRLQLVARSARFRSLAGPELLRATAALQLPQAPAGPGSSHAPALADRVPLDAPALADRVPLDAPALADASCESAPAPPLALPCPGPGAGGAPASPAPCTNLFGVAQSRPGLVGALPPGFPPCPPKAAPCEPDRVKMQCRLALQRPVRAEEAFLIGSRVAVALQLGMHKALRGLPADREELRLCLGPGPEVQTIEREVLLAQCDPAQLRRQAQQIHQFVPDATQVELLPQALSPPPSPRLENLFANETSASRLTNLFAGTPGRAASREPPSPPQRGRLGRQERLEARASVVAAVALSRAQCAAAMEDAKLGVATARDEARAQLGLPPAERAQRPLAPSLSAQARAPGGESGSSVATSTTASSCASQFRVGRLRAVQLPQCAGAARAWYRHDTRRVEVGEDGMLRIMAPRSEDAVKLCVPAAAARADCCGTDATVQIAEKQYRFRFATHGDARRFVDLLG